MLSLELNLLPTGALRMTFRLIKCAVRLHAASKQ